MTAAAIGRTARRLRRLSGVYESLKETPSDPQHPEHEEMKGWPGLTEDETREAGAFSRVEYGSS